MTEQEKIEGILSAVRCYVPGFNLKLKSESRFQKFIGKIFALLGNKTYMSCFWTTIGKTVYRPAACKQRILEGEWKTLLHEGRHVDDCYKLGLPLYCFIYLFPQIIGILGVLYALALIPALLLGAPGSLLWGLLALICLAPIPAFGRAAIEARAYLVSMYVDFWDGTMGDEDAYIDALASKFVGPSYYYMWFYKRGMKRFFRGYLDELKGGYADLDSYLLMCRTKAKAYK